MQNWSLDKKYCVQITDKTILNDHPEHHTAHRLFIMLNHYHLTKIDNVYKIRKINDSWRGNTQKPI